MHAFPRGVQVAHEQTSHAVDGPEWLPGRKRGRVLVADDNTDAGWGITKLLDMAGFETLRVSTGRGALAAIEEQRPDAAILDIGMPDLTGHEVARRVRAADWGRTMVLVAATGWGDECDERDAVQAGFDAYMTKPLDMPRLAALLDSMLAAKRR
jgi:two-component system CheB/CheR fusion protein